MNLGFLVAIRAGVCFGMWPFFQKMSGVEGAPAVMLISMGLTVCMIPFGIRAGIPNLSNPSAAYLLVCIVLWAVGNMSMVQLTGSYEGVNLSRLMVLTYVANICAPVVWTYATNPRLLASIQLRDIAGFVAAIVVAWCFGQSR